MTVEEGAMERAAAMLRGGGVVAFTGAGVSAESGIPTFRDPGGIWDRFDPGEFGTWEGLAGLAMTRPDALAEFLAELRRVFGQARPGPAHVALAEMGRAGLLDGVVTQNVDGLHQEAGSQNVIELHGSFLRTRCMACGHAGEVTREEFLQNLDHAITGLRTAFVPGLAALLPHCDQCGSPARPDFVAFGDAVQRMDEAERMVRAARVLLVVGTSGEVFPAARLPEDARAAGATVIEVAGGPSFIQADLRLEGRAGGLLPALVEDVISDLR
jgi:NAD-dependent protein deacetylase/lipoamidase